MVMGSDDPSWKVGQEAVDMSSCVGTKERTRKKRIVAKEPKVKSITNDTEERKEDVVQSHEVDVSLLPPGVSSSIDGGARNKVRETLRLFQAVVRKFSQEAESNKKMKPNRVRIDLEAAKVLKEKGKYVNTGKSIIGIVPGVEVGDEFHFRVELMMVGLHRPPQSGIDYVTVDGQTLATSVVDSGGYDNRADNYDIWVYTGQGGGFSGKNKEPEDQKLERGNLALRNSIDQKNLVRVIRGVKDPKAPTVYTYYGLYTVEKFWQVNGVHGTKEYKFELKRVHGQPELAWKEVNRSKRLQTREGCCVVDISEGKEKIPICAVNTVDDEKPPSFTYITEMIYPEWCKPIAPRDCSCKRRCLDSVKCSCAVKNGGECPYNNDGAIVQAKQLLYECGPCCKCPPTCSNRVSQHGIKFQLEIFKTETRGWGVRSMDSIPSGSFVCEYIGELLEDKEAENRDDEYLFDIGQNYNDHSLWEGLSSLITDVSSSSNEKLSDVEFAIDAGQYGNVGRFVNHSCSPNLYAQSVLYDHDDSRMPHIMLFAVENIPPLQELTYHYNYTIGSVRGKDGIAKVKYCYCGSSDCSGRLY